MRSDLAMAYLLSRYTCITKRSSGPGQHGEAGPRVPQDPAVVEVHLVVAVPVAGLGDEWVAERSVLRAPRDPRGEEVPEDGRRLAAVGCAPVEPEALELLSAATTDQPALHVRSRIAVAARLGSHAGPDGQHRPRHGVRPDRRPRDDPALEVLPAAAAGQPAPLGAGREPHRA